VQHTTNGSEEYYISLGGTGRDRKIWKRHKKEDYFGWDAARMESERRAIQAMDWNPEGKRKRGRPRNNWQEDVQCMDMRDGRHPMHRYEGSKDCVARCADLHRKD